jgi:excisionase family DNA binding protein
MSEKLVLSVTEYAKLMNIGRDAAYTAVRNGDVPSVRVGNKIFRIPVAAVEQQLGLEPGKIDRMLAES